MILHTEYTVFLTFHAFDGIIQKIDMGNRQICPLQAFGIYSVGMVLRGDFYFICFQISHRVVSAPVSEFQLIGLAAVGQRNDLMPQTDAENGHTAPQLPHRFDNRLHFLRVAGAIGKKHPIR